MALMAKITLKGSPIHTVGSLPQVGVVAPDFRLVGQDLSDVTLKNFKGKKKILSIVPSLDTAVCSIMAKKFNAEMAKHPDAVVLVVSRDLPFAQKRFCTDEKTDKITTLSMMRNQDFGKEYGVLIQDGPLEGVCARAVMVLDEEDKVLYTELVSEVTDEPNYEKALSYL